MSKSSVRVSYEFRVRSGLSCAATCVLARGGRTKRARRQCANAASIHLTCGSALLPPFHLSMSPCVCFAPYLCAGTFSFYWQGKPGRPHALLTDGSGARLFATLGLGNNGKSTFVRKLQFKQGTTTVVTAYLTRFASSSWLLTSERATSQRSLHAMHCCWVAEVTLLSLMACPSLFRPLAVDANGRRLGARSFTTVTLPGNVVVTATPVKDGRAHGVTITSPSMSIRAVQRLPFTPTQVTPGMHAAAGGCSPSTTHSPPAGLGPVGKPCSPPIGDGPAYPGPRQVNAAGVPVPWCHVRALPPCLCLRCRNATLTLGAGWMCSSQSGDACAFPWADSWAPATSTPHRPAAALAECRPQPAAPLTYH